jgi:hypothetical protein
VKRRAGLVAAVTSALVPYVSQADGLLPPRPYHYLHPPSALARSNRKPVAGDQTVKLNKHHQTPGFVLFTGDGQAGLGTRTGAFSLGAPAKSARVHIAPVQTPPHLPKNLQVDGNAYTVAVTGKPGGHAAKQPLRVNLVLRWPRLPSLLYRYSGKRWSVICTPSQWTLSTGIIICPVSSLGTFVMVIRTGRYAVAQIIAQGNPR